MFLDELPEFDRRALEVLREPLETGEIVISRVRGQCTFPADFQLLAAMNPCPCGYHGDGSDRCRCSEEKINRYRGRISGPLLDRIDLHVPVMRLPAREIRARDHQAESSAQVADRVRSARTLQINRQGAENARLEARELERWVPLDTNTEALLESAADRLRMSGRGIHRVLKIARTIADLDACDHVQEVHLSEALSYRSLG